MFEHNQILCFNCQSISENAPRTLPTQQSLTSSSVVEPPKKSMFSGNKKSGGGFGGFGLGKFVQQAKQAGEQIQAKAQQAAQLASQAASTGDLSQIGSTLSVSFLRVFMWFSNFCRRAIVWMASGFLGKFIIQDATFLCFFCIFT